MKISGMIASIASLLNNRDLLDKIVPKNQGFPALGRKPRFVFNLYERGKPQRIVVNDSLVFFSFPLSFVINKLFYSGSCNNNFLGPLFEKALVELHFDGDYRFAEGVDPIDVFSSFSNAFYERINNGDSLNILYTRGGQRK